VRGGRLERSKATGSRTGQPCCCSHNRAVSENFSTWLSVGIMGNALPPRDPNDDYDDDEDEDEEDQDEEPAVVREPDDDE
jgi:hypothetical protein